MIIFIVIIYLLIGIFFTGFVRAYMCDRGKPNFADNMMHFVCILVWPLVILVFFTMENMFKYKWRIW